MLVPVSGQMLLETQRQNLAAAVAASIGGAAHVDGFASRLMGPETIRRIVQGFRLEPPPDSEAAVYEGYPRIAYLGFGLGCGAFPASLVAEPFLRGLRRLRVRPDRSRIDFVTDDIAILGIADGLASLRTAHTDNLGGLAEWIIDLADSLPRRQQWSWRARAVAADLLDGRGRLRVPPVADTDALALEQALQAAYPRLFLSTPTLTSERVQTLIADLLTAVPPGAGELDRAAAWLVALNRLVDAACVSVVPTLSDTVRLISRTQHALKRWPWEEKATRRGTAPARWLIDDEYDVQSLLWAVLYPVYGDDLIDETYLPDWGNVRPRADLGILKLKLIIEVKFARYPSDFAEIEGQVGADHGLYFKDTNRFDHMVVVVYDDSDEPQPERYDGLRNSLKKRERIEEVVIIQRPSMIPNRRARGAGG